MLTPRHFYTTSMPVNKDLWTDEQTVMTVEAFDLCTPHGPRCQSVFTVCVLAFKSPVLPFIDATGIMEGGSVTTVFSLALSAFSQYFEAVCYRAAFIVIPM